jgi:hypothetical protein
MSARGGRPDPQLGQTDVNSRQQASADPDHRAGTSAPHTRSAGEGSGAFNLRGCLEEQESDAAAHHPSHDQATLSMPATTASHDSSHQHPGRSSHRLAFLFFPIRQRCSASLGS